MVAATIRDLQGKVKKREFREDLYYRLKNLLVKLPPLRQRSGDIPLLVSHFVEISRSSMNKNIQGLDSDVTELDWCKRLFDATDLPGHISWKKFLKKGYYIFWPFV